MFLGYCFAGTDTSIHSAPITSSEITTISLGHMILDELYVTKKLLLKFNWEIPPDWDFDTCLHALYQGNTYAGNISFSESIVQKIRVKKRYAGDFRWDTIYEKDINCNEDFAIEFYDYYCPSRQAVEYAYVAVIGGTETTPISSLVNSEFYSYFICDKDASYPAIFDTANQVELNRATSVIQTIGNKYPFVVANGTMKYYSGTLTATFIEVLDGDLDVERGWKYRNQIDEFLSNGNAKIIKSLEGQMYMVNIINNIPRTENGHFQNVSHKIDWVECGDPRNTGDLYDNGFIDVDADRR